MRPTDESDFMVDVAVLGRCERRYLSKYSAVGDFLEAHRLSPIASENNNAALQTDEWLGKYHFRKRNRDHDAMEVDFCTMDDKSKKAIWDKASKLSKHLQPSVLDPDTHYITSRQRAILHLLRPEDLDAIYEKLSDSQLLVPDEEHSLGTVGAMLLRTNEHVRHVQQRFKEESSEKKGAGTFLTSLLRTTFADY